MNSETDSAPLAQGTRTSLAPELAEEVRRRVFAAPGCLRFTQVARQGGHVVRTALRPVRLREGCCWQVERLADGRVTVRNLQEPETAGVLDELLAQTGPREFHLRASDGDLHVRVTRKGRVLLSRGRAAGGPQAAPAEPLPHDRVKTQPLSAFDSAALLRVLGFSDGEGRLRASMRGKYDQVNKFLHELRAALPHEAGADRPLEVVDCGSGRAYLTLAAYAYLTQALGWRVRVTGIDRNAGLVDTANRLAADLGVSENVRFIARDLADVQLEARPQVLLSLHACDTATDEALARGVEWGAERMLVAPCCQHDLQPQLAGGGAMRAVLRHGILRERLADLLADTFRAQLLRILGYRVRIVEFVSPEATARNLLLRAESGIKPGQAAAVDEYRALRDLWQVVPPLEARLASRLARWLER